MKKPKKKFNWLTRLNRLARAKTRRFKPRDFEKLVEMANGWPTCACGELCQSLPRLSQGEPEDSDLSVFGVKFYGRVLNCDWSGALATFRKIERRSAKLLRAMAA